MKVKLFSNPPDPDTYRVKVEAAGFKVNDVAVSWCRWTRSARRCAVAGWRGHANGGSNGEVPQLKTDRADVSLDFSADYVEKLLL